MLDWLTHLFLKSQGFKHFKGFGLSKIIISENLPPSHKIPSKVFYMLEIPIKMLLLN